MINAMMIQLYQPLNFMGMVYREIKQAVIDIEKMFAILAREPEIKDKPGAKPLDIKRGAIRFENVSFAYDPEREISRASASRSRPDIGWRWSAPPAPASRPSRGCCSASTRSAAGASRSMARTSATSRRNRFARRSAWFRRTPSCSTTPSATTSVTAAGRRADAEVEEAARLAQIDDFIRLSPKGYDTEVGERGLKLSGGEKQRVAIARTILKAPPILLLDEATSALDSHTEREIQDALERVSENRTTLVIAHGCRPSSAPTRSSCSIRGVIVERGTHHQLLAKGGLYASMWNRQREARRRARSSRWSTTSWLRPTAIRRRLPKFSPSRRMTSGGPSRRSTAPTRRSDRVRSRLHPLPAGADPPRGPAVHRRVRAGQPVPVLAVVAAGLARHHGDDLVRLFLSRSRARDAGARGHRGVACDGRVSRITNAVPPKDLELGERPCRGCRSS
jgi:hypothetical protein